MGMKSKALGFFTVIGLSLSMIAGASAQNTANTNVSVYVTGTNCTITASSGSVNLGQWLWDGKKYVLKDPNSNKTVITWTLKSGNPSNCDGTLKFTAPKSQAGDVIGLENFHGSVVMGTTYISGPAYLDGSFVDPGNTEGFSDIQTGTFEGRLELRDFPDDIMPGNYFGNIKATVNNGQ